FVNGNMFAGLFGDRLFVRLSDTDRTTLMQEGGSDFEPMPGRAMKGYTVLPDGWIADTEGSARWVEAPFSFTVALPVKEKKPKKGARQLPACSAWCRLALARGRDATFSALRVVGRAYADSCRQALASPKGSVPVVGQQFFADPPVVSVDRWIDSVRVLSL